MAVISGNGNPNGTFANDPLQKFTENQIALDGFNGLFAEDLLNGGGDVLPDNGTSDSDIIQGNTSPNRIGNDFSELMLGTADNNEFFGRAGDDTLMGFAGFDTLKGELGNDSLRGGDDADLLDGGDGADFLAGEKGNDTMLGGSGNDLFEWVDGDGSDLIQGGDGIDNLLFNGSVTQGDRISLGQSGSDILLQRTNLVPATLNIQGIERFNAINGGGGDDELTVSNLDATSGVEFIKFAGGDGNDRLISSNVSANFDASGGNGNDFWRAVTGMTLCWAIEEMTLFRGNGNDRIQGAESSNLGRGEIDVLIGARAEILLC
ncbi:MAG: hypothetical protein HC941_29915 [Microcoleus sp. SU_5_3]|nr:hypothetical protein [Microcoleus sp. SU_5_3]